MIHLWFPNPRCMGGICLGSNRQDVLELGVFIRDEDDAQSDNMEFLEQLFPNLSVALCDDIVVSIAARDECFLDDVNLIGLPLESVASRVGGIASQTDSGEVDIYVTGSGLELYVRDGLVSQIIMSDWSLVKEPTEADQEES